MDRLRLGRGLDLFRFRRGPVNDVETHRAVPGIGEDESVGLLMSVSCRCAINRAAPDPNEIPWARGRPSTAHQCHRRQNG